VTATVDSIPLIASSIMSKKIAAGADAIVLDVKTGSGAFMKDLDGARRLAEAMVSIGGLVGRKTTALISDMSQPLGLAIGNALEVKEAIATLKGEGPKDLTELCLELGSQMAVLAGVATDRAAARGLLEQAIADGAALLKFKSFIESQGGNGLAVDDPELLPEAAFHIELPAWQTGYITSMAAQEIGHAAMLLGAGRETKESVIDLAAGILLHKKTGDSVQAGEPILTIHTNKEEAGHVLERLQKAIVLSAEKPAVPPLIYEIIE